MRKEIEAEFVDTKFIDQLSFIYYRGIEKVMVLLKFPAHDMESFIVFKVRLRIERKIGRRNQK